MSNLSRRVERLERAWHHGPDRPHSVVVPQGGPAVALYPDGTRHALTEAELAELRGGPGPLKWYKSDPEPMWKPDGPQPG